MHVESLARCVWDEDVTQYTRVGNMVIAIDLSIAKPDFALN